VQVKKSSEVLAEHRADGLTLDPLPAMGEMAP
jgi:hypothetical protein